MTLNSWRSFWIQWNHSQTCRRCFYITCTKSFCSLSLSSSSLMLLQLPSCPHAIVILVVIAIFLVVIFSLRSRRRRRCCHLFITHTRRLCAKNMKYWPHHTPVPHFATLSTTPSRPRISHIITWWMACPKDFSDLWNSLSRIGASNSLTLENNWR